MANSRKIQLPFSFWALNATQFLGAMNDNLFRWVVGLALMARASDPVHGIISGRPVFITGLVFAAPFILFSSFAGVLADRYSKRQIIFWSKIMEVAVMMLGILGFLSNSPFLLYCVVFLMETHSAIFGPSKYGILPELVPTHKLSYANGIYGMYTYLAILIGTAGGGFLYHLFGADNTVAFASTVSCWKASIVFVCVAALGLVSSLFVENTGARSSGKEPSPYFWKEVARNLRLARANRYLYSTLFALAFFLFLGGYVQQNFVPYATSILGVSKDSANYIYLALAMGIGLGSLWAGKLSGRGIEIGLVPAGAMIASMMLLLFIFPIHSISLAVLILLVMGIGGGFYNVPLSAYMQREAPEKDRGEIIATCNFLSFCGVALSAAVLLLLDMLGVPPGVRFFMLGIVTLILTGYVIWVLPDFLLRFVGLVITRLVYRLEVVGAENIPQSGGALLVANHVSYVDAVLLMATQQRRIRFVMDRRIYSSRGFNWLFRLMRAIPISRDDNPKQVIRSLRAVRQVVEDGYLVCIFAEGGLTRLGYILGFKRGFEHIMRGLSQPVIPVNIHGIWGSVFTYAHGRVLARLPRDIGRRVLISFGQPMPPNVSAYRIRHKVMELQSEAFERHHHRPLPLEFARMARSRWRSPCMTDTTGKRLRFGQALVGSMALASVLKAELIDSTHVGLLLPTSVGAALSNIAVSFLGKVPVNLNFTAPRQSVESAIRQCNIRFILTSRSFIDKVALSDLPGLIYIEDLTGQVTRGMKIWAFLRARFVPLFLLGRFRWPIKEKRPGPEDTATVIFSSGSTGEPKGVELTHYNIRSNVEAIQQVFRLSRRDVVCGVLPFFHSFGYTGTLWLPLLVGIGVSYHYNPTEAETVGKLVSQNRCTLLVSTPTFLMLYIRKVAPEQFASLRIVITGAEKLKERIAAAFREKFSILPMEGYGATELSPVACVNVPSVEVGGVYQEGSRAGSIGRPIPGVTMKIVDPDDPERELELGQEGLLLVRGPNVMKGYLGKPKKTAEVMLGDWYITGDMAKIDEDGFVTITDRLSRFSKIGGEMIPHMAIEEKIQETLGMVEPVCAVTALPDESRGEKLVVLLTPDAGDPMEVHRKLKQSGMPNLWVPSRENIIPVASIPVLGTGKVDLKGVKDLAREHLEQAVS